MGLFKKQDDQDELLSLNTDKNLRSSKHIVPFNSKSYGAIGPPAIAKALTPEIDPTLFTNHGKGIIDFVLAYQPLDMDESQTIYRQLFEAKLREQGLFLEHEDLSQSQDGKTCFVKIHAPWDVLARMAEANRVKVPIKQSDLSNPDTEKREQCGYKCLSCCCCGKHPAELEYPYDVAMEPPYFTLDFNRAYFRQYLVQDPNMFFTQAQRINMVWDIVERITISGTEALSRRANLLSGQKEVDAVGLSFLIPKGVYVAAYPLHDADTKINTNEPNRKPTELWPLRPWLREVWARPGRWYKYQPLDQIRAYFGEKAAIYFAWLGFYTYMLIPLTIVGILCTVFGVLNMVYLDPVVVDFCSGLNDSVICRKCGDEICPFTTVKDECINALATSIFNNYSTLVYALFTSLWCICFLEFWKRYQSRLACKWDTFDVGMEYEPPRPEYILMAKSRRRNPVSQDWEPYVPARSKAQRIIASVFSVTFMICLVAAVIAGVIIYKIVMAVMYSKTDNEAINLVGSDMFTTITASVISSLSIIILETVYGKLAWYLTEKEYPRTDNDFEVSYTYKMYIFQFINYYALLFYLAFVQPTISGTPENDTILSDRCAASGCTFTVTVQLATVLATKMVVSNATELGIPMVMNWLKRRKNVEATEDNVYARYEKDFDLSPLPELGLFMEYFEMVMQYGFVTLFVATFPLAPLLALLNNIVEIRLDAYKFVAEFRRALPLRAADIGTWYDILELVSHLAVLTNALIIAFTTDITDRLVYVISYSPDHSLDGYLNWSLSYFNPMNWSEPGLDVGFNGTTVDFCRYRGFYDPPWSATPYWYSEAWWRVMLAKLAFVLVFEHVVILTQAFIQYLVPDIPDDVSLHMHRSRYLTKAASLRSEQTRRPRTPKTGHTPNGKIRGPPVAPKPQKVEKIRDPTPEPSTSSIGPSASLIEPNYPPDERPPSKNKGKKKLFGKKKKSK